MDRSVSVLVRGIKEEKEGNYRGQVTREQEFERFYGDEDECYPKSF